jgi:hypothetical protein
VNQIGVPVNMSQSKDNVNDNNGDDEAIDADITAELAAAESALIDAGFDLSVPSTHDHDDHDTIDDEVALSEHEHDDHDDKLRGGVAKSTNGTLEHDDGDGDDNVAALAADLGIDANGATDDESTTLEPLSDHD